MICNVLIKAVVNVRVDGIECESHADGIAKASKLNLNQLFDGFKENLPAQIPDGTGSETIRYVEYADENGCYLVDEAGDDEFERSKWYGKDGETPLDQSDKTLCSECLVPKPEVKAA